MVQRLLRKKQDEENDMNDMNDMKQEPATLGDIVDNILGPFPKGIPARKWKQGKGYDIDISSEGFKDLPLDVRLKAYKLFVHKMSVREAAVRKIEYKFFD